MAASHPTTSAQRIKELTALDYARAGVKVFEILRRTVKHMFYVPTSEHISKVMPHGQAWGRDLLDAAGVTFEIIGEPPPMNDGVLQASNHRSFMDILVLMAASPGIFVAKADVADWPVIGPAAGMAGVIFVEREQRDSRRATRVKMEECLREGLTVNLFPEGTTNGPPGTLPFKRGGFEVAVDAGAEVVPIAIEYPNASDAWTEMVSAGKHFAQAHAGPKDVKISFGPRMRGDDGAKLALDVKAWIDAELERLAGTF